jgi:hypothetical protein
MPIMPAGSPPKRVVIAAGLECGAKNHYGSLFIDATSWLLTYLNMLFLLTLGYLWTLNSTLPACVVCFIAAIILHNPVAGKVQFGRMLAFFISASIFFSFALSRAGGGMRAADYHI